MPHDHLGWFDTFQDALHRFSVNQGGVIAVGALVAFLVFGDLDRLRSPRNFVMAGLLMLAPFFVDLVNAGPRRAAPTFAVIYLLTAVTAVWAWRLSRTSKPPDISPRLGRRGLQILLVAVLLLDFVQCFANPPDDAGIYSNLGARRWVETGTLPYGDPMLKGADSPAHGAAATYGPVLLAAHVPYQVLVGAHENAPDLDPMDREAYVRPPHLASQLCCFTFFLIGVVALWKTVEGLAGPERGLGAAILYASSPYVLGLGGDEFFAGGLMYISHIAPSAVMTLAFLFHRRPFLCGALVAAAAGMLYYPAFLVPAWFGYRLWKRDGWLGFLAGFAAVGALLAAVVILGTHTEPGENPVKLFLQSTLEHQEGAGGDQYGESPFSFWGTHPGLASVFHTPLFGSGSLFKATFFAYASLCIGSFWMARGRTLVQLAAMLAMLAAALQLWKSHATGTYVEWYSPFLLIALLGHAHGAPGKEAAP